ncbi:hypothetical protein SNOG_01363 [Parastagonospora nodorum SN15]|uniref:Uncharacterized protein n=1 Tax=Phaeosphaeria nodorum (strain SN15 / ATCC MYA-4574 / FGSC 10173) TaxID=321614 RepID=Q0V3Q1_PHANO|nr:hypothetical protein SNOG_01363 [Parastagonospora nodorum SN15]EAT91012.1 hypothetical protein SNOG_01363 [Parastagonospora nodorum SN15]
MWAGHERDFGSLEHSPPTAQIAWGSTPGESVLRVMDPEGDSNRKCTVLLRGE